MSSNRNPQPTASLPCRLALASFLTFSNVYSYLPDSDLLQTTTGKCGQAPILTTTRHWDYGVRLRDIANTVNGFNVSSHSYLYDAVNRRYRATLEDGSHWDYGYNDRNELTSARRYWVDNTHVAGQQFTFDYDNIGNRTTAQSGGDSSGANLRETTYSANALNQYASIQTLGYKDIIGAATGNVTVDGYPADKQGAYFRFETTNVNTSPVWANVTVSSGSTTITGGLAFPAYNQPITNDLDGNLTGDGIWTYEWDGENRLKTMTMNQILGFPEPDGSCTNYSRLKLEFAYDYLGR